ncbi:APC family permease [Pleomorphovibrio marinus]|uniref:APC family permease n=1 Tax=Pleomorphovibrio marinus TaxID=2164132 RepID=UPI000E0B6C99|nr:amino acid permease [Pleomorphovibrio marinus]
MSNPTSLAPKPTLNFFDAVALIVGIVIGAGIFRTPSLVAANSGSWEIMLGAWVLGGIVSIIGALCYAELTSAFPNTGGDYHFLRMAFGKRLAFLFAWSRLSVVQTGSIALLAFIFGDYATLIHDLGPHSSVIYAGLTVIVLTVINIGGVKMGAGAQKILTVAELTGIILVIGAGLLLAPNGTEVSPSSLPTDSGSSGSFGLAMVFVLLTFGGWNEAAYLSGELKKGSKLLVKALISGIITITIIYALINLAYYRGLGMEGMANSNAVAGDLMKVSFGDTGAWVMAILVAIAALTSANASMFTGARSNFALGRDFSLFSPLGEWKKGDKGPINSFIIQGIVALLLVGLGLFSRNGFETMVEYTAPVFWFFFLLVGISLFLLRKKAPETHRPYKVPLYPLLPILFCISSAYLLYSSIAYTGWGALLGVAVLILGVLLMYLFPIKNKSVQQN